MNLQIFLSYDIALIGRTELADKLPTKHSKKRVYRNKCQMFRACCPKLFEFGSQLIP